MRTQLCLESFQKSIKKVSKKYQKNIKKVSKKYQQTQLLLLTKTFLWFYRVSQSKLVKIGESVQKL